MAGIDLVKQVKSQIEKLEMLEPGDKVLIGVSGGSDSIALLHILWTLKGDLRIIPVVAHLNHQLRGEEAKEDARSVREFSEKLELPCYIEKADVKSYHKNSGLSLQEACREIRFSFFEQLAGKLGARRVALGHHADDQAETILLNLLRGAGISGLKGISYIRGLFIRPLLEIRRKEIEGYCLQHNLPVRQDSSNLKPVYTRNRIRLNLLPLLEREYNPQIVHTLAQLGNLCSEEDSYLEELALINLDKIKVNEKNGMVVLDNNQLRTLSAPLCRRVLRLAWNEVTGEMKELSYHHVEKLTELLHKKAGGRVMILPRGIRALKTNNVLQFFREAEPIPVLPYQHPLIVPGVTYVPEIDLRIQAEVIDIRDAPPFSEMSPNEALLDYDLIKHPLFVRRRLEGDVFSPFGLGGTIKLKKFLIDSKVARYKRDRIPLVVSGADIVWVGGLRLSQDWKVTGGTVNCLYLQILGSSAATA
ncbi:MAG: tRNA lysidine(34) synthetase TilS [Eubacteriales bacterium]